MKLWFNIKIKSSVYQLYNFHNNTKGEFTNNKILKKKKSLPSIIAYKQTQIGFSFEIKI